MSSEITIKIICAVRGANSARPFDSFDTKKDGFGRLFSVHCNARPLFV